MFCATETEPKIKFNVYIYIYIYIYISNFIYIYIYIKFNKYIISSLYRCISLVGGMIAYGPGDWASISGRAISKTQKWHCRNVPPGFWGKARRTSQIVTTKECYVLFWTNPGSSSPQKSSSMVTYLLFHKSSK